MDGTQTSSSGVLRIAREVVRADDVRPEHFLRWGAGSGRGFWARERGWVAHFGVIARIEVRDGGEDRFRRVWAQALEIVGEGPSATGADDGEGPTPRFYGGFAFRDDHRPEGVWSAFPSACFVLPEVELERRSGATWLWVQTPVEPGEQPATTRQRLRDRMDQVRAGLRAQELHESGHPVPLPASRRQSDRDAWETAVRESLDAISAGLVTKVVLARTLEVSAPRIIDPVEVLMPLWEGNPEAHVFLFEPEPGHALVGAAPETIATLYNGAFHATAVAGSVPRGATPDEEAGFAQRLLESHKDRVEHAVVLDDVVQRLQALAEDVSAGAEPHVLTLARIQHLETHVRAKVPAGLGVLRLLESLHPTPAVCGLPRDEALEFLRKEEPFDRGWYAGPVGWFDGTGDGVFVPALRTAVVQGTSWRLFAGAGIVPGSDPALEWEETGIKFEPVLRALSASGAL